MTAERLRRVAMFSVHTSPLEQPGTGDAGGLNVYVVETAKRLAERGTEVEIFTRATSSDVPALAELAPGVLVRALVAGPFEGLSKNDLPAQLCAFAAGVLRVEARHELGWYDLIHSHYWLSGQVGWLAADRWQRPLVQSMHTMAKVKNQALAAGDRPEPQVRIIGEEQVVAAADRLIANTQQEARELIELYDAEPERVAVVSPGVDLDTFSPGGPEGRRLARWALGVDEQADLVLFVGRLQPLKGPDVLIRAVAELLARDPGRRAGLRVAVLGGASGTGLEHPEQVQDLVADLGLADVVAFHPPVDREGLAQWYRAADVVAVPSFSESFGLVAVEAQACGVPVLAARVGGLPTVVDHGVSGLLVEDHEPATWAGGLRRLLEDPNDRRRMGRAAIGQAGRFGWQNTVEALEEVYLGAVADHRRDVVDLGAAEQPRRRRSDVVLAR